MHVRWTRPLADRVVLGEGSHVRAFAGETILLVAALTVLSDMVLPPASVLSAYATAMRMLVTIQCLVLAGAFPHMQLLDELLGARQELFLALYRACAPSRSSITCGI